VIPFLPTPSPLLPNFLLTPGTLLRSLACSISPPGKGTETAATQASFWSLSQNTAGAINIKNFVVWKSLIKTQLLIKHVEVAITQR